MRKNFMIMGVMTMVLLNVSQANAEGTCVGKEQGWGECRSSLVTTGIPASCGTGCSYTYNNGTIFITADKNYNNPNVASHFFSPIFRENNQFTDEEGHKLTVTNVVIDGVTRFNFDAFYSSRFTISGKDGTLVLDSVGYHAMNTNTKLAGNVIWRGNSVNGFNGVIIEGNLIIEDTASFSSFQESPQLNLGTHGKVFCNTDMAKCQALLTAAGANNAVLNALQPFPDGCNSLTLSGRCAKCKNNNFNLNDGECDRIRWTPAEAAKVLRDDNTNVVTITFKLQ